MRDNRPLQTIERGASARGLLVARNGQTLWMFGPRTDLNHCSNHYETCICVSWFSGTPGDTLRSGSPGAARAPTKKGAQKSVIQAYVCPARNLNISNRRSQTLGSRMAALAATANKHFAKRQNSYEICVASRPSFYRRRINQLHQCVELSWHWLGRAEWDVWCRLGAHCLA